VLASSGARQSDFACGDQHDAQSARRVVMTRLPQENTSAVAREIAPDVFCLGPRGRTQTNVYFVRSGSWWVLVDAGWAKDGPSIKQAAKAVFGADTPPASILLTHFHPDHAGSALGLARGWDCPVYLHPAELPLANGDFTAMTKYAGPLDHWVILPLMRAMGRRRRQAMIAASSLRDVARLFDPDAGVPGLPGWECITTPGHTPGHVSFFRANDRVTITGDAIVTLKVNSLSGLLRGRQGLSGPPWYTSWSWRAAKASVAKLARLEPNVLACGHGTPMIGAGTAGVLRTFADHLAYGPRNTPALPSRCAGGASPEAGSQLQDRALVWLNPSEVRRRPIRALAVASAATGWRPLLDC
jgi:glyoxylase-like metal-dependent hydrolase (beta-lactamase superfamily II)